MSFPVEPVLALVAFVGVAALKLGQAVNRRRQLARLDKVVGRTGSVRAVEGHAVEFERIELNDFDDTTSKIIERTIVRGVLPPEISFSWQADRRQSTTRTNISKSHLWLEILFGNPLPTKVPVGHTVRAEDGDLTCETLPSAFPSGTEVIVELARTYLTRPVTTPLEALVPYATGGDIGTRAVALLAMSSISRDRHETRDAFAAALKDPSDRLRMLAAGTRAEYSDVREDVLGVASTSNDSAARIHAIRNILFAGAYRDLLEVGGHPLPEAIQTDFLSAISRHPHPGAEKIVISYLDFSAVAALDALAVIGSRQSVMPINDLVDSGTLSAEARFSAQHALDTIKSRLTGGTGGLALAQPATGGELSVRPSDGQLSDITEANSEES